MSGTGGRQVVDQSVASAFTPRIVAFLCNWCSYAGSDKAGASQLVQPSSVVSIRLMCTGRMDPQFVVKAFDEGADGVLILGCHPGDCHYKEQNYRMIQRHRLFVRLLEAQSIEAERCRLEFVSASEGEKFARVVAETVEIIRKLGPRMAA
ncbi:MAG TPA: hydrogenase iron-sulfur subunit [Anaeromyxobacteraceae bacterium]|nr:hydrogenase iron-sulfur subunit [Anaeromyxobacteraceae bacterium]